MTILVLAVALNDVHGGTCTVDEQCVDADACTRDVCSAGRCTYPAVAFGDVDADALVAVPDIICILDGFAGSFEICGLSAADLSPCTQDGVIDLDDVLAGLDALRGLDACCGCAAADEGLPCDDGDECTVGDECVMGICTGGMGSGCVIGNLTVFRPQHGTGYFPFVRTAVSEDDEDDAELGAGIRLNDADSDPFGEDDLIEVVVVIDPPGAEVALRRTAAILEVWTTRSKDAGSAVPFIGDKTSALPLGPADTQMTVWVEASGSDHGVVALGLEPAATTEALDTLTFHTFQSIVMALGGENQVPSIPLDANNGTFVNATSLYSLGYDVHQYDEDNVGGDGFGAVYNEIVTAVQDRHVVEVAVFGYSHGGGSTHDLAERLDIDRAGIGDFEITFTSYVDGVGNASDIDVSQQTARPPASGYHANHYQVGSLTDFFLDGGPVIDSNPAPTGLNVETTPWGNGSTHFEVDDYVQVRTFIEVNLLSTTLR